MALREIRVVCRSCGDNFTGKPSRTFLGFQKLKCPKCGKDVVYPLTRGYRITYWILLVGMIVAVVGNARQGLVSFPGLIGVGIIIAVIRDFQIQRAVADVRVPG